MSEDIDTVPDEFKPREGPLPSAEDVSSPQAGHELGQEIAEEGEKKAPLSEQPSSKPSTPLFLSDSPEGKKGNAQDEKDESEE